LEKDDIPDQGIAAAVEALDREFERAILAADVPSLEAICAPDMRWTHSNYSRHQTRGEWIDWVAPAPGQAIYTKYALMPARIEEHGEIAVAAGSMEVLFSDGRPNSIRFVRVYAMRDNRLQLISHHTLPL